MRSIGERESSGRLQASRLVVAMGGLWLVLAPPASAKPRAPHTRAPAAEPATAETESEADVASQRERWWARQRAFPGRLVPAGAGLDAARAFAELSGRWLPPVLTPDTKSAWTSLGPAPLAPTDEFPNASPAAGRLTAIALHPSDSRVIFVGSALGGVWRSDDGGATWQPLTDGETSLAIGALAIDPSAPDTVYAGTGESPFGYLGHGLLKSTDGGKSWTHPAGSRFTGAAITRLVVDAEKGALYLAAAVAQDGRGDQCRSYYSDSTDYGLWRSTDGGTSWTRLLDGQVIDVEVDTHATPRVLYVAQADKTGLHAVRLVEGGAPEKLPVPDPNGALVALDLALAPSDPQVLYAATGDIIAGHGALFVSTDAGAHFSAVPGAPDHCADQCTWSNAALVDPTDAGRVYLGGTACSAWRAESATTMAPSWRAVSMPDGSCARGATNWKQHIVHPDAHAFAIDGHNPSTIYVATDGGLYRSADRGGTWEARNQGLSTLQFYAICQDPKDPGHRFGGTQDNCVAEQTADGWKARLSGDGAGCIADVTSADRPDPYPLLSTFFAQLFVDGDLVFQAFPRGCNQGLPGCGDRAAFTAPLARDPQDPSTVYVGTQRVWRSTDGGAADTWNPISDDLTGGPGGESCTYDAKLDDYLTALTVAPSAKSSLYTGSAGGVVSRSFDGGAHWNNVTGGPLPDRWVSALAVDAVREKTVYAAYSGFSRTTPGQPGHVFRSLDGGDTWSLRDLPIDIPVDSMIAHPRAPGVLYVGTDAGVFATVDGGGSWVILDGLPAAPVYGLTWHSATATLTAATYGRGVFSRPLIPRIVATPASLSLAAAPLDAAAATLRIDNGDSTGSVLEFTVKASQPWLIVTPSSGLAAGPNGASIEVTFASDLAPGEHDAVIEIADPNALAPVEVPVHVSVAAAGCGCDLGRRASSGGQGCGLLGAILLGFLVRTATRRLAGA